MMLTDMPVTEWQDYLRPAGAGKLARVSDAWQASVTTERNEWPSWVRFGGSGPCEALEKLLGYFKGEVPDHASAQRPPALFMRQAEGSAA